MTDQKSTNITWHGGAVARADREKLLGQRGVTVWLTGLSAAGKSTIAVILERMLLDRGRLAYRLDGDNVRHGLNKNLGFTTEDRAENIRRIGEVAKLFTDAGAIVIASFISPYRSDRDAVRSLLAPGDFVEVYVKVSVEAAERRDPKGLYKKARAGEIKGFTGIDDPYEEPQTPELLIDTEALDGSSAASTVLKYLAATGVFAENSHSPVDRIGRVLSNLDGWRHLPSYQLERRADAFFAAYLVEFFNWHFRGIDTFRDDIIPELPLKQTDSHRSDKVDYVLFNATGSRVYFIELKTDAGSIREEQINYLQTAKNNGFKTVLENLLQIICRTASPEKYVHLLQRLENAGCVTLSAELRGQIERNVRGGRLNDRCFEVIGDPEIEVIVILPKPLEKPRIPFPTIYFKRIVEFLREMNDPFTNKFRESLENWIEPAGEIAPERR